MLDSKANKKVNLVNKDENVMMDEQLRTRQCRMGNTIIRDKIRVTSYVKKMVKSSLGWCGGHDQRRLVKALRRVNQMEYMVQGLGVERDLDANGV